MTSAVHRFKLAFYIPPTAELFDHYLGAAQSLGVEIIATGMGMADLRDEARLERMREAIVRRRMRMHALHSPIGLASADGDPARSLADNQTVIAAAAHLGAVSTVWHFRYVQVSRPADIPTGERVNRFSHDELDAMVMEVLPETCEYAAAQGVQVNLENLPLFTWSGNSYEILDFLRAAALPNLGYIIDTGHSWANAEDPAAVIRAAGPLLLDTHIHDNLGPRGHDFSRPAKQSDITPARDLHLVPGLGTINWIEVVRALRDIDYRGPICFEGTEIRGHPDTGLVQALRCADLSVRMWRAFEEAAAFLPDPA